MAVRTLNWLCFARPDRGRPEGRGTSPRVPQATSHPAANWLCFVQHSSIRQLATDYRLPPLALFRTSHFTPQTSNSSPNWLCFERWLPDLRPQPKRCNREIRQICERDSPPASSSRVVRVFRGHLLLFSVLSVCSVVHRQEERGLAKSRLFAPTCRPGRLRRRPLIHKKTFLDPCMLCKNQK